MNLLQLRSTGNLMECTKLGIAYKEGEIIEILYSGKVWWGESMANLANHP